MKKLFCMLTIFVLLSFFILPCYASEVTKDSHGSEEIGVYINVDYMLADGTIRADAEEGSYIAVMPDGTVITVAPETVTEGYSLVVYPILKTDTVAYQWFADATEGLGNKRYYYEIFFIDAAGNRVDSGVCQVTISLPEGYGPSKTALLGTDGTLTTIFNSVDGIYITFTMTANGYYVIAESIPSTDKPVSPETGDHSDIFLWTAMLLISGTGIVTTVVSNKRRKIR